MATKKVEGGGSKKVAVIGSLVGLTAAAVGAYYLYGHKDATKNRAKVKSWMLKAKGEVLEKLEGAENVTESAYMTAVDAVLNKYHELKSVEPEELQSFMGQMKDYWAGIQKTVSGKKTKTAKRKK